MRRSRDDSESTSGCGTGCLLGAVVLVVLAFSLAAGFHHRPRHLPSSALGSIDLLGAERSAAFFIALLLVLVVVVRAFSGQLPSALTSQGLKYEKIKDTARTALAAHDAAIATQRDEMKRLLHRLQDLEADQPAAARGARPIAPSELASLRARLQRLEQEVFDPRLVALRPRANLRDLPDFELRHRFWDRLQSTGELAGRDSGNGPDRLFAEVIADVGLPSATLAPEPIAGQAITRLDRL